MNTYEPEKWVIIEISTGTNIVQKVFCGNYGGYTGSDTWKLNSGNVSETEFPDRWEFTGANGSVYICYKHCYGMSNYMFGIFKGWLGQLKDDMVLLVLEDKYATKEL